MHLFASVHLSVCVYRAGAQKPYMGLLRGKECMENSHFWYLETLGWGLNLGKNEVYMLCVSGRKWCRKFGGIQKYILVVIFIVITSLCT